MTDQVTRYFFTFGCGHPFGSKLIVINVSQHSEDTFNEAREAMARIFGTNWCGQYAADNNEELEYCSQWRVEVLSEWNVYDDGRILEA